MPDPNDLNMCPFCKAGETQIREHTHWTGMRNMVHAVTVMHWCLVTDDNNLQSFLQIKGKTREQAIRKWNKATEDQ